jgi:Dehydrogenase E1 component
MSPQLLQLTLLRHYYTMLLLYYLYCYCRYRGADEVKQWQTADDPLKRLQLWLERKDLWTAAQDQATRDDERLQVMAALEVSTHTLQKLHEISATASYLKYIFICVCFLLSTVCQQRSLC